MSWVYVKTEEHSIDTYMKCTLLMPNISMEDILDQPNPALDTVRTCIRS